MIVQCDKCQTKYRIADEKVKGKGVKVRCAKCENVFTVKPPAPPKPSVPTPTPLDTPESTPPPETGSAPARDETPKGSTADETGSISTNGKRQSTTPLDFSPPRSPLEDSIPPTPLDFSPPASSPEADTPSEPETPPTAFEDPLFSTEPLGRSEDAFPRPDQLSITGSVPNQTVPEGPLPESGDVSMDWGNIALDPTESHEAPGRGVDFALPAPREPSAGADIFSPAVQPPPEPGPSSNRPTAEATRVTTRQGSAQPSEKGGKGLMVFVILLLLGAGGYFAYPKIAPLIGRFTGQIPGAKTGGLTVENSRFGSIKRSDGTTLVTVRGVVVNNTGKKQGMLRVTGEFKGAGGGVLARSSSFCGNLFSDEDLNLMAIGEIRSALQNELGQSLSNSTLAPGKSVPFLLILENPVVGKIKEVTFKVASGLENSGG